MNFLTKLNLYNFWTGFLAINVFNMLFGYYYQIDSYQYRIFSVILAFVVIIMQIFRRPKYFNIVFHNNLFKMYAIFAFFYLLRLYFDRFYFGIGTSISASPVIEMSISISYILAIPFSLISIWSINDNKVTKKLLWILSVLFIINALYNPLSSFGIVEKRMSTLENLSIHSLGLYASILLIWSIIIFIGKSKTVIKIIFIPITLISLYYVAISGTRSVFLGTMVIILLFLFQNRKIIIKRRILTILIFISVLLLALPLWEAWLKLIFKRFQYGIEFHSTGRQYIWGKALEMFYSSPIIGTHHVIPGETYFHNYFLDAFVSTGIFGGILFLVMNIKIISICINWLRLSNESEYHFFSITFLMILTYGMFSGNLYSSPLYWGSLVLIIIASIKKKINMKAIYEINN